MSKYEDIEQIYRLLDLLEDEEVALVRGMLEDMYDSGGHFDPETYKKQFKQTAEQLRRKESPTAEAIRAIFESEGKEDRELDPETGRVRVDWSKYSRDSQSDETKGQVE